MPKRVDRGGWDDTAKRKARLEQSIQGRARRALETLWKHGCIAERGDPTAYQILYDALKEQRTVSRAGGRSTGLGDARRNRRARSREVLLEEERRLRVTPVPNTFDPFKHERRHRVSRTLL